MCIENGYNYVAPYVINTVKTRTIRTLSFESQAAIVFYLMIKTQIQGCLVQK